MNEEGLDQRVQRIREIKDKNNDKNLKYLLAESYDLVYEKRSIAIGKWAFINPSIYHVLVLGKSLKKDYIPTEVLRDLDRLGPNRVIGGVIGCVVLDIGELSYDKVRESFDLRNDDFLLTMPENTSQKIKSTQKAFQQLYSKAVEAESFLKDYEKLAERT